MPQRTIQNLSTAECFELVSKEKVGRLVFVDAEGPVALPVNYSVAGEQIVFRLAQNSNLRDAFRGPVAFEVDHTDLKSNEGWSILIRGTAQEIPTDRVPEILRQMGETFPHPWAEGVHNVWASVTAKKITGRRLTGASHAAIF
jgi:uncharacterized protein